MNKRQARLTNLRWYCDLAIEGARLQRSRVLSGEAPRHDLDVYALCVWRLVELARQAKEQGVERAGELREGMVERWPALKEVRDWWTHARPMQHTAWFSDAVRRLGAGGSAPTVIHARHDHAEVEQFYEQLCDALGPLPE